VSGGKGASRKKEFDELYNPTIILEQSTQWKEHYKNYDAWLKARPFLPSQMETWLEVQGNV